MDTSITSVIDDKGNIEFDVADNMGVVTGNRALSNRFAVTLLTKTSESLLAYGYGGNIQQGLIQAGGDASGTAAAVKSASDQTVAVMKTDQDGLAKTEQIDTAEVESVDKVLDRVFISIRIIPVELDAGAGEGPLVTLPI